MHRFSLLLILLAVLSYGCTEERPDSPSEQFVENRFEDAGLRTIHDYQDRQYLDSLAPYFNHEDARYRREAAMACASMQNGPAIPFLLELLEDPDASVAATAAYAIGQTNDKEAAGPLRLAMAIPDSVWKRDEGYLYGHLAQALGNIGDSLDMEYVIFQDGELTLAKEKLPLVRAIYQFSLRGVVSAAAEKICSDVIVEGSEPEAAQLAANCLARRREMEPEVLQEGVLANWEAISDPVVRMNIARAMRHLEAEDRRAKLLKIAMDEREDYRTRVNALAAYKPLEDSSAFKDLSSLLNHKNEHVAHAASVSIRNNFLADESGEYLAAAVAHPLYEVRGELYRAGMKAEAKAGDASNATAAVQAALAEAKEQGGKSVNYEIGLLLVALAESPENTDYLFKQVLELQDPVQKGYAMIGITIAFSQEGAPNVSDRLDMLKQALATEDPAVRSLVSYELLREDAGYKTEDFDATFIEEALEKIKLPEGIEAYRDLQKTLYALTDEKRPILMRVDYNHPIDWDLVARISQNASATVTTNKGDISFDLFVDETPATVANFVELAQQGYFEGRFFHRVVPNFVVQTGCPRGDGWGSLAHSIRSEFPDLHYGTGAVGMASAGKDTESSQFFITHSPTPHLDGRYTVFGKVSSGMEVVHKIKMGDFIEKVTLKGIKAEEASAS